jgi:hypothetical protein
MTNPFDTAVPLTDQAPASSSSNPFDQAVPVGPQRAQNVQSNDVGMARLGTLSGTSRQPQAAAPQPNGLGVAATAGHMSMSAMAGFGSPLQAVIGAYGNLGEALEAHTPLDIPGWQDAQEFNEWQNQYRAELGKGAHGFAEAGNMGGEMTSQILLGKLLPTSQIVTPIEEAPTMFAQSQNAAVRSIGRVGSSTLRSSAAAIPYGTQAGLTTPLQNGETYGQHMAQNVQGAMEMGAAITGGLSLLGEAGGAAKAGAEATARLFRGTKNIKLAPEVLHGESVPDVMNAARMDSDLVGNQTMNDIQQTSQMDGIEGAKARTVMQRLTAATASDHNVELSLGDLSGDPNLRAKEQALESKPGSGMNEFRERQGQEVRRAVIDLGRQKDAEAAFNPDGSHRQFDFENPDPTVAPSLMDQVQKDAASRTAGDIGANPTQAERLVGNITDMRRSLQAGDNTNPKAIQLSLQGQEWQNRQIANQKYGEIGDAIGSALKADPTLPKIVDVTPVQRSIQNLIDQNETSPAYDKDLATNLTTWQSNLSREGVDLSYPSIKQSISQMESKIADLEASGNTNLARQLRGVKGHLDLQAENYAKQVLAGRPEDLQLIGDADQFYKKNVVPYSDPDTGIGDIARGIDADKAVRPFFTEQSPDQFNRMFNLLDERGKAAVRAEMVGRTEDAASRMKNFQDINLPSFARYLENRSDQINTAYGDDTSLPGLAHLIRNTPRAGYQSKLESLFGMNNVGGGVAKMAMGGLGALGGSVAGPGGSLGGAMLGYGAEPAMEAGINRFIGSELINPTLSKYIDPSIRLDQYGLELQPTPIEQPPVSGLQDINANRAAREAHYAKIGNPAAYESPAGPGGQNGLVGPLGRSLEGQPVNYGPDSPNPRPMPYTAPKGELGAPSLAPQPRSLGAGGQPSASLTEAFEPPTPNPQFTMQGRAGEGYADPYARLKQLQANAVATSGDVRTAQDNYINSVLADRQLANQVKQAQTAVQTAFDKSGGTNPYGWEDIEKGDQFGATNPQTGAYVSPRTRLGAPPFAGTTTQDRAWIKQLNAAPWEQQQEVRNPTPDEMREVATRMENYIGWLKNPNRNEMPTIVDPTHPLLYRPLTEAELPSEISTLSSLRDQIFDYATKVEKGQNPPVPVQMDLINRLADASGRLKDLTQLAADTANSPINTESLANEVADAKAAQAKAFSDLVQAGPNQRQPVPANNPSKVIPTQSLTAPFTGEGSSINNPRGIQTATRGIVPQQSLSSMAEPYQIPQSGTGLSSFDQEGNKSVGAAERPKHNQMPGAASELDRLMAQLRAKQAGTIQGQPPASDEEAMRTFNTVNADMENPLQKAARQLAEAQEIMRTTGIQAADAAREQAVRELNRGLVAPTPPNSQFTQPHQAIPTTPDSTSSQIKQLGQQMGIIPPEPEGNPQSHTLGTAAGSLEEQMMNLQRNSAAAEAAARAKAPGGVLEGPNQNRYYGLSGLDPSVPVTLSQNEINPLTGKQIVKGGRPPLTQAEIDEAARAEEIKRPGLAQTVWDGTFDFGQSQEKTPTTAPKPATNAPITEASLRNSALQDYMKETAAKRLDYNNQIANAQKLNATSEQLRKMKIEFDDHIQKRVNVATEAMPLLRKQRWEDFDELWGSRP